MFLEAIERLAGGTLDATEDERDETKNDVSTSESDIVSMSYDDEDEYIAMLESIPLDNMSNAQEEVPLHHCTDRCSWLTVFVVVV